VEIYDTGGQATDNNLIQCMRFARWITKATNTHRDYAIVIDFPRQQWLHEHASILRYTRVVDGTELPLVVVNYKNCPY
jgi:hypothetical protein